MESLLSPQVASRLVTVTTPSATTITGSEAAVEISGTRPSSRVLSAAPA